VPLGAVLGLALLAGPACRLGGRSAAATKADSAELANRASRLTEALAHPDTSKGKDAPLARFDLPRDLREISGLALTADGRLLAHDDNIARVVELDYRHGTIVKRFLVGSPPLHGDFEGITVTPGGIFLLQSNGRLYQFPEGADGARVEYRAYDTGLGRDCEFEGVAYERASNSLLLACKTVWKPSLQGSLVIYRWRLGGGSGQVSRLTIPLPKIIGSHPWKGLHPSDITIDPTTGNYVLVASREKALIAVTPQGGVVFARPLHGRHAQAEGVAITRDGILLISDEAGQRPASLTLYRWP